MSEEFIVLYLILGVFFTIIEHRSYEYDFTGFTNSELVCSVLQQLIHYSRYIFTYPWYLLEDIVVYIDNRILDDE